METMWLFRAELRRYFAERWSHFGNLASTLFYAVMVFGAIVIDPEEQGLNNRPT